jgi:hypothetical protein
MMITRWGMRLVFCAMLGFSGCKSADGIEVFLSEHNRGAGLRVVPYEAYHAAFTEKQSRLSSAEFDWVDCMLVIRNRTDKDIYICDEQYEIGYYDIELQIKFKNNEVYHLKKKKGVWYRNLQTLHGIPSGGALSIPITLDDTIWENFPGWTDEMLQKLETDPFLKSPFWDDAPLILPEKEIMVKAILNFVMRPPDPPRKGVTALSCATTYETDWTRLQPRYPRTTFISNVFPR